MPTRKLSRAPIRRVELTERVHARVRVVDLELELDPLRTVGDFEDQPRLRVMASRIRLFLF
jgi:hypothetical protein